jgi:hypothetical protein
MESPSVGPQHAIYPSARKVYATDAGFSWAKWGQAEKIRHHDNATAVLGLC